MGWKGFADSRPEASKPAPGKLDRSAEPKSPSRNPTGSESFGDKMGGKSVNWKGMADGRPDCK